MHVGSGTHEICRTRTYRFHVPPSEDAAHRHLRNARVPCTDASGSWGLLAACAHAPGRRPHTREEKGRPPISGSADLKWKPQLPCARRRAAPRGDGVASGRSNQEANDVDGCGTNGTRRRLQAGCVAPTSRVACAILVIWCATPHPRQHP